MYKSKLKSLADDFYTLEWNAEMDFILVFFSSGKKYRFIDRKLNDRAGNFDNDYQLIFCKELFIKRNM
ncbi:hypothetical protein B5G13_07740 [Butyricimonas sp. An62]|nr:hypothetical protein B5G13_07740 [Butyricimonas sp. An62]